MNQPINLHNIYRTQAIIVILSALVIGVMQGPSVLIPFLAGAAIITLNFALLQIIWSRMWDKKPVAITLVIIVFKYAVLGIILYYLTKGLEFKIVPLMVGIGTILGSFLAVAVQAFFDH